MKNKYNENVSPDNWDNFRKSGLLWYINQILHLFGWAIIVEIGEDKKVITCYPAKVKFRGFDEESNTEGYKKVTEHLSENITDLLKTVNEP